MSSTLRNANNLPSVEKNVATSLNITSMSPLTTFSQYYICLPEYLDIYFISVFLQCYNKLKKSLFYASLLREMNNRRCYKKLFFPSHSVVLEPVFLPSQATIFTLSTLISSVTSLNSTSFNTKVHTLSQNLYVFREPFKTKH